MSELSGRVAIVTGGSQGIGLAYVTALAAQGASVVIADLHGAQEAAAAARSDAISSVDVDVTDPVQVQDAITSIRQDLGRVDILVNNAAFYGGLSLAGFEDIPESDWDKSMAVNVKGVWLMSRAVSPVMRAQGHGRVINIASNVVFMGKPNFLHYVASKGAVWALTNALSREFAGSGVTVNCVAPGYTITPATREMGTPEQVAALEDQIIAAQSVKRLLEPEDMVGAVLYLSSDAASMVTGQTIVVDGGVIVG